MIERRGIARHAGNARNSSSEPTVAWHRYDMPYMAPKTEWPNKCVKLARMARIHHHCAGLLYDMLGTGRPQIELLVTEELTAPRAFYR